MFGIGATELVLILVIVLIVFGASRLPKLGQAIGQTLLELKKGIKGLGDGEEDDDTDGVEKVRKNKKN